MVIREHAVKHTIDPPCDHHQQHLSEPDQYGLHRVYSICFICAFNSKQTKEKTHF